MSSCPYIPRVKSSEDLKDHPASASSTPLSSPQLSSQPPLTVEAALSLAKSSCPAFQSSCPFKNVKDAEEMRRAMANIPKSHLDMNVMDSGKHEDRISSALRVALQHVHHVSHSLHQQEPGDTVPTAVTDSVTKKYEISGGCPFKTLYTQPHGNSAATSSSSMAFVEVMEKFSLSAIMASMIHSISDDDEIKPVSNTKGLDTTTSAEVIVSSEFSPSSSHRKSLSKSLKTGTAASHIAAESVHFVKEFIHGKIDRNIYSLLVVDLYHIYSTLEQELDIHGPILFPQVYFPKELNRKESLKDDVEFFHGVDSLSTSTSLQSPTKAAQEYQERLRYIASKEPLLLLSHAYTRYLGDLSGGRLLARVARRAMNLSKETSDGLRFYEFDHIASPKLFKDEYRRCLDDMEFSPDVVERLVAEANVAFVLNMRVFEEFDVLAGVPGATVRPMGEALIYYEDCIQRQNNARIHSSAVQSSMEVEEEEDSKCPFAFLGGPNPHAILRGYQTSTDNNNDSTGDGKNKEVEETIDSIGRCPWPFILLHDPLTGFRDYQTWIVLGLVLCWVYKSWFIDGGFHEACISFFE